MLNLIFVFTGGALGSLIRYIVSNNVVLPYGTLLVNIFGCFILGILSVFVLKRAKYIPPKLRLGLTSGFCGGVTTFSTFSYEVFVYIQKTLYIEALLYVCVSLILGILFVYFGIEFCRLCLKLHLDNKRAKLRQEFLEGE